MNKKEITEKQEEITEKQEEIDFFEIEESDHEQAYCDMLDECYEGIFDLLPSRILLECDPIQYNCGMSDYVSDSCNKKDDPNYCQLIEDLEELQDELKELQDELNKQ